jgi:hypothetical protein
MLACFLDLTSQFQNLPSAFDAQSVAQNQPAWSRWCCNVKQALADHFATYGGYDCEAVYNLQAIVCPASNLDAETFFQAIGLAVIELAVTAFEGLVECFCAAALPPCHDAGDPRVPLALINVRRSDCTIVSVCNWTPLRRQVITFVTLRYWLGWIPYGRLIRSLMEAICCNVLGLRDLPGQWTAAGQAAATGRRARAATPAAEAAGTTGQDAFSQPLTFDFGKAGRVGLANTVTQAVMFNLASPPSALTAGDLGRAMFQPLDFTAPSAERLASQPAIKILSELIRPLTTGLPPALLQPAQAPPARDQPATPVAAAADVEALRTQLTQLQQTVAAQQAQIDALRTAPSGGRR